MQWKTAEAIVERMDGFKGVTAYLCGRRRWSVRVPNMFQTELQAVANKFIAFYSDKSKVYGQKMWNIRIPVEVERMDPQWLTEPVRLMIPRLKLGDYECCPILADALQEAGCDEETLLKALRGGASPGSWVLPYLTGTGFFSPNFLDDCKMMNASGLSPGFVNHMPEVWRAIFTLFDEAKARLTELPESFESRALDFICMYQGKHLLRQVAMATVYMTSAEFAMWCHGRIGYSEAVRLFLCESG